MPAEQARARSLAGIATSDGRLFIARRKPGGAMGGKWEFPGGKAEKGESDEDALRREFMEEFGVGIKVGELWAEADFSSGEKLYRLGAYGISFESLDFTMTEHDRWRWARIDEIEEDGFVGSDFLLLPLLAGRA